MGQNACSGRRQFFFLDKCHSLPIVSTLPNPPSTVFEARIDPSASIPRVTINKAGLSNKLAFLYLRRLVNTVLRVRRLFPRIATHLRRGRKPVYGGGRYSVV